LGQAYDRRFDLDWKDMEQGKYGQIDYRTNPYRITINTRNVPAARQSKALTHEILHAGNRDHKWGLAENGIHDLTLFIHSKIFNNDKAHCREAIREEIHYGNKPHNWNLKDYQVREVANFVFDEIIPKQQQFGFI
jgi:hypothetical protein